MCHIGFFGESFTTLHLASHLENKKLMAGSAREYHIYFLTETANLALRAIIDCNISRAVCATQHSTYLCDLPRAILRRYL